MLDPVTGADKTVNVAWDSALELATVKRRARPCGYWLGADQADAALRLRGLGVHVQRLDEAGALRGEAYAETARELAARSDVRGSIADAGGILRQDPELIRPNERGTSRWRSTTSPRRGSSFRSSCRTSRRRRS